MSKYKRDVTIDKGQLDVELESQPILTQKYCELLADARLEAEEAKNALSLARADVTLDVIKNPHDYDLPKATEMTAKAATESHPDVVDAKKRLATANHHVGVLESAVNGLVDKKKSLEGLTYLQGQNYYSEPKVSEKGKRVIRRKKARTRDE